MKEKNNPDEENLEIKVRKSLEIILENVCHSRLNPLHTYIYQNLDQGIMLYLSPTKIKDQMSLQIRNLRENSDLFDEYLINFTFNS